MLNEAKMMNISPTTKAKYIYNFLRYN